MLLFSQRVHLKNDVSEGRPVSIEAVVTLKNLTTNCFAGCISVCFGWHRPADYKAGGAINTSQEYIDWVANLSADLPNSLSPSPHLSLSPPPFNNKMRRPVIDCDLCPIRIKGGSIAPFLSLNLSFPPPFLRVMGLDGWSAETQKKTKHISRPLWCKKNKAAEKRSLIFTLWIIKKKEAVGRFFPFYWWHAGSRMRYKYKKDENNVGKFNTRGRVEGSSRQYNSHSSAFCWM